MKRPNAVLKLAAVASSVVLVAGFVCYRAGAFDSVGGSPAVDTATDAVENPPDSAAQQPTDGAASGAMLSGSKSIIFVVPPSSPTPGGSTAGPPPAILSSSKFIAPLIPPASPSPAQAANPPK